jgi:branched-subunit amino acid ABC-type transport system permease component
VSIAQDAGLNMFFVTIAGGVGFIVGSMIITLIIILIEKLKAK